MSPQDREKENRVDAREDNRKEKEKSDKPPRLGKEAKIGAAVILVLLVTLVTVVIVRLKGSNSPDKKPDAVAERDGGKHKPQPGAHDDPLSKEARAKMFGNPPPTVVTAQSTPTKPPTTYPDKWSLPSDKGDRKRSDSRYSSPKSEPFATDLPKPPRASRYEDVAVAGASDSDADASGRFRKNDLRPEQTDAKKSARTTRDSGVSTLSRDDFNRAESKGRASSAADPAPLPNYRGSSRYDDSAAALLPPTPARDTTSYGESSRRSTQTQPVSRFDDDFPRSSKGSSYDRGSSRQYAGSSYGNRSGRRDDGKYEVQPNDSYSSISEKLYGTNTYFKALAELNRGKFANENRLQPGELISAPSAVELQKMYPDLCPKASRLETQQARLASAGARQNYNRGRSYTVAEGDTLFNIARYELGKASRWAEIYELNREVLGKDFNYLTPGMKLVLPDNEKSDVLTSRPGDPYR